MAYPPDHRFVTPAATPLPQRTMHIEDHGVTMPGQAPDLVPVCGSDALTQRHQLLQRLGISTAPSPEWDDLARSMAEEAGFLYGFINLFLAEQTFVGLYQPHPDSGHVIVGRTMRLDHGWCPAVVDRQKALPLHDVHASPRFSGNPVTDRVGIRSYYGAPLIHPSGVVLGTACVIDPEPRHLSDSRRIRDVTLRTSAQAVERIDPASVRQPVRAPGRRP
ncbi:GAF domain-containing protein [Streptomyces sp. NPDC001515]